MLTDGRTTDGRTDAGVTGILIAHLGAFGSGELIITVSHSTLNTQINITANSVYQDQTAPTFVTEQFVPRSLLQKEQSDLGRHCLS